MLRRHLANQEFERRARGDGYRADLDLVFPKADGSPCDVDVTTRRFTRVVGRCAGVLSIRFHDLRHTHATLLLEAGESVKYVAERLGDREETVVETYAHVTPRMRSSAVSKVRGFLGSDPGARDAAVVRPAVGTGAALREPPVSPPGSVEPWRADRRA